MRDLFDPSPTLRLGDAKAKRLLDQGEDVLVLAGVTMSTENTITVSRSKGDPGAEFSNIAVEKPASLDPAFGDAFGAALSKPRPVPEEKISEAVIDAYIDAVARSFGIPDRLLKGPDSSAMTATQRAEVDAYWRRFEMPLDSKGPSVIVGYGPGDVSPEQKAGLDAAWDALGIGDLFAQATKLKAMSPDLRGAKLDDVTITGIARKTGDGAVRYEPAPPLKKADPK
jgi:hypothetical protein